MTLAVMNDQSRLRQFYLRFVLAIGVIWGTMPLIMTPFIVRGPSDTSFDILAAVLNSLTVLPASILGFWHRRVACAWLTANAILLVIALGSWTLKTHDYEIGAIIGCGGPVALALFLDMAEVRHWPPALDRAHSREARMKR
jgi:hypothetical protein